MSDGAHSGVEAGPGGIAVSPAERRWSRAHCAVLTAPSSSRTSSPSKACSCRSPSTSSIARSYGSPTSSQAAAACSQSPSIPYWKLGGHGSGGVTSRPARAGNPLQRSAGDGNQPDPHQGGDENSGARFRRTPLADDSAHGRAGTRPRCRTRQLRTALGDHAPMNCTNLKLETCDDKQTLGRHADRNPFETAGFRKKLPY